MLGVYEGLLLPDVVEEGVWDMVADMVADTVGVMEDDVEAAAVRVLDVESAAVPELVDVVVAAGECVAGDEPVMVADMVGVIVGVMEELADILVAEAVREGVDDGVMVDVIVEDTAI